MKKIFQLSITLLLFFCETARSEGKKDYSASFNPEIFSLSKKKESAFDAPSATYVLGSEEIRRSGATSIPEALRLVPGLQVARINGNQWAISARGFNAQYSNKLLVMIDGRIIYTPVFSGVFWDVQDYVIEDIDRVEVVRGPGGSIWGANAVNGVINIITKSAAQTQGAYVSQIVGSQDKSITEVRYGAETAAKDSYRLYAKKAVRDGVDKYNNITGSKGTSPSNHDGNEQNRAGFRYDVSSIKDSTISVHGDVYSSVAKNYFAAAPAGNHDKDSKGANVVLNWDKKISKKSNFTINAYVDYDQFDTDILKRSANTYDIDFQHFYNFSKENQFSWGVGYRRIDDSIKNDSTNIFVYTPSKMNSYVYSGFVQDKIGIVADELYLTLGSKFMDNNFTGFEYQPSAKLAYYPTRNQTIWSSVSRSVRTPTRGEDGLNLINGFQRGSTSYKSEDLMAYELGYRIKPISKVSIDVSSFFNRYTNLRTFEQVSAGKNTAANNGHGESYGFELSTKWQVTNDWKLESGYDFLKTTLHIYDYSTDVTAGSSALQLTEGQSPKSQFKLKSFYNITPKFEFDNFLYYVDSLPLATATSTSGLGSSGSRGHIPSYVRIDTRLGYLPNKNLDLSIGIQNLLDTGHSEFKPGLANNQTQIGRTFYFKAVWQY